jgi:hypothetical protein
MTGTARWAPFLPRASVLKKDSCGEGYPKMSVDAGATKPVKAKKRNGNGANLGFEAQLFLAADKLQPHRGGK